MVQLIRGKLVGNGTVFAGKKRGGAKMEIRRNGKKADENCKQKKGWLWPLLFMLAVSVILIGPPTAGGNDGIGTIGGPLTAEWAQRNWGKAFGRNWNDEAFAMGFTADGGSILAGRTYSFDESGYGDAWLLRLSPGGDVEWEKRYGDLLWDVIFDVQQTADGGFVAAGDRYPPDGSQEAWVMKLKSDGEVEWQSTYGRADHYDSALAIRQTADGGFILLGRTQSYTIGGEQGAWVLKLTGSGAIEWQKFLGGNEYDILFSVEQTTDGGYVLAGGTYSYSDAPFFSEVWMVKMFPNGDIAWEKTYGGPYDDVAYSVKPAPDGGYVLTCWTAFSRGDVWVLKTDAVGNLEWQQRYGGDWADVPTSMILTSDGGFVIGGYTSSFGSGSDDGWVFKAAANGRIEWQKTFGGSGRDAFNGIVETETGYAASGYTSSFGAGEMDFWIVNFTPVGPGTLLLNTITGPSHARTPAMEEVTEKYITGYISNTLVSPVASVTTTSATAGIETLLSRFPGKGKPFSTEVGVSPANGSVSWPIFPKNHRLK